MFIKLDGEIVGTYDEPMDLLELSQLPEVVEALQGREIINAVLHPSKASVNLISAPPISHLPHAKRKEVLDPPANF